MLTEQGVFLTTDARGEIPVGAPEAFGLYYQDTRFLSGFALRLDGGAIPLLGVEDNGYVATLTYGEIAASPIRTPGIPPNVLIRRTHYIDMEPPHPPAPSPSPGEGEHADGTGVSPLPRQGEGAGVRAALRERISITSYNRDALDVGLTLALASDFTDIFEVRHVAHGEPGTYDAPATPGPDTVVLAYTGRDAVHRRTTCTFAPAPDEIIPDAAPDGGAGRVDGTGATARYALRLEPHRTVTIDVAIALSSADAGTAAEAGAQPGHRTDAPLDRAFDEGLAAVAASHAAWLSAACTGIETDSAALNRVLDRGLRDLRLLLLRLPTGPYVAAGIPWFAVPFGRDAIITAIEMLPVDPDVAVGTLRYLAAHQGRAENPARDEEPGKIMHEMRVGETVRTGVAPFGPYYGSVDATPLFLVLLGRAVAWLGAGDGERGLALARELEGAMRAALGWLDGYGDRDGDGYVEYKQRAGGGIANQGWKDSFDSLQFPDGSFPEAPIALVEVQGYAYEARRAAAALLGRLGDEAGAAEQEAKAAALCERFNRDFWLADEGCYAQALDRDKRPIPAVTSNAGHPLWSGIADDDKAATMARCLMAEDMCAGWGIRTLSCRYPSYNPISYHNGSIWPHDTALVAAGLKRYGHDEATAALLEQVVAAAQGYADGRLPELYGGLQRRAGEHGPIPYPVSCSPQAWAAGSILLLLQGVLGLERGPDDGDAGGATPRLRLRPVFPPGLGRVTMRRLRVGAVTIDLTVEARADGLLEVRRVAPTGATLTLTVAPGEPVTVPLGDET